MIGLGRRVMSLAIAGLCLLGVLGAVSAAAANDTARPAAAFSCGSFVQWSSAPAGTTSRPRPCSAPPQRPWKDRSATRRSRGRSNSKLEGLNSKIRLINHRGYGHHSAAAIIAMIYLCCGGITVALPTGR